MSCDESILWGMPHVVKLFMEQLPAAMKDKYLFAVATYKSQPGAVMEQTDSVLWHMRESLSERRHTIWQDNRRKKTLYQRSMRYFRVDERKW